MSYATTQDLIDRYGIQDLEQLTDHSHAGGIDNDVVDRALADADAEINSSLAVRLTLPLTGIIPPRVIEWACVGSYYRLFRAGATELATERYRQMRQDLKAFADGTLSLGLGGDGEEIETEQAVEYYAPDRIFTSETLAGY